jgi:hypothetical protein
MAMTQENKSNPAAQAGSKNSLGAESVRDGRPATDDDTVEAIDEANPGVTGSPLPDAVQADSGRG